MIVVVHSIHYMKYDIHCANAHMLNSKCPTEKALYITYSKALHFSAAISAVVALLKCYGNTVELRVENK